MSQESFFCTNLKSINIAKTMCLDLGQGIRNCTSLAVNHHSIQLQVLGNMMVAKGSCLCYHLHLEKNQTQKHVKNLQALTLLNDSHQRNIVGSPNRKHRFSPSLLHLPACKTPPVQRLMRCPEMKVDFGVENPVD